MKRPENLSFCSVMMSLEEDDYAEEFPHFYFSMIILNVDVTRQVVALMLILILLK